MSSANLPLPINGTEQYLAAIHHRLGEVLDRLSERSAESEKQAPAAGPETVELREPAPAPEPAPEGEALKEPTPPAPTTTARKRTNRKGGT